MTKVSYMLAEISIVISDHFTEMMYVQCSRVQYQNMEFRIFIAKS
jgi:hypothetical protein